MEYQFIREPAYGFRARFNQEHALFGRWLSEEVAKERLSELEACVVEVEKNREEVVFPGREIRLTLSADEALLQEHALFHGDPDLSAFQDDMLMMDESGMMAACGFEDFVAMLVAWRAFVGA